MALKVIRTNPLGCRYELLAHPNIPKPLHGLAPRVVKGQEWWDVARREAYAKNNYCCFACGEQTKLNPVHPWLEAHESYSIDYEHGRMELKEIVALCHDCHAFIHNGKLWMDVASEKITFEEGLRIMRRGIGLCEEHGVEPFHVAYETLDRLLGFNPDGKKGWFPPVANVAWGDWRLVVDGVEYASKFANFEEWERFYQEKNEEV